MTPFVLAISIISVVSIFVLLPGIIVGGSLWNHKLKLKERELLVREKELELERERLSYDKVVEARAAIERAGEIVPKADTTR
ncbi:MAG: hypothetical protein WCQ50_06945 [Spirochaetota bacterium]